MENASKALLMIAGVLIGILILSLAVYLFSQGGRAASKVVSEITEQQIQQFNRQFDKYLSLDGVTIYDIVTVAKAARDYNKSNNLEDGVNGYIKIQLNKLSNETGINKDYNLSEWEDYDRVKNNYDKSYQRLFDIDRNKLGDNVNAEKNNDPNARDSNLTNKVGYLPIYTCLNTEYDGPDGRITFVEFQPSY